MESIEKHIESNIQELGNPTISSQRRRHIEDELDGLEKYHKNHPEDHHDPSPLEVYCDSNPDSLECRIYED